MTRGKYDDPVFREEAFVPHVHSFGSVKTDHLEIRTRLSAAVTTTQLLLERLKKIPANNFGKVFFPLDRAAKICDWIEAFCIRNV